MSVFNEIAAKTNSKSGFVRLWTRGAANQPGIPVDAVSLKKEPFFRKPKMRRQA